MNRLCGRWAAGNDLIELSSGICELAGLMELYAFPSVDFLGVSRAQAQSDRCDPIRSDPTMRLPALPPTFVKWESGWGGVLAGM